MAITSGAIIGGSTGSGGGGTVDNDALSALQTQVAGHTNAINANTTRSTANQTNIATTTATANTNAQGITANAGNIATLQILTAGHTTDISDLDQRVVVLEGKGVIVRPFSTTTDYEQYQFIISGSKILYANADIAAGSAFNSADWTEIKTSEAAGLITIENFSTTAGTTYPIKTSLVHQGVLYRANKETSSGTFTTADWDALTASNTTIRSFSNFADVNSATPPVEGEVIFVENFVSSTGLLLRRNGLASSDTLQAYDFISQNNVPVYTTEASLLASAGSHFIGFKSYVGDSAGYIPYIRNSISSPSVIGDYLKLQPPSSAGTVITTYDPTKSYSTGQPTIKDGVLYVAKTDLPADVIFDEEAWTRVRSSHFRDYNSNTLYRLYDTVIHTVDGVRSAYICNTETTGAFTLSHWTKLFTIYSNSFFSFSTEDAITSVNVGDWVYIEDYKGVGLTVEIKSQTGNRNDLYKFISLTAPIVYPTTDQMVADAEFHLLGMEFRVGNSTSGYTTYRRTSTVNESLLDYTDYKPSLEAEKKIRELLNISLNDQGLYEHTGSPFTGDRRADVTISSEIPLRGGYDDITTLLNGVNNSNSASNACAFNATTDIANKVFFQFDFGSSDYAVTHFIFYGSGYFGTGGDRVCKVQGSNDGTTWDEIGHIANLTLYTNGFEHEINKSCLFYRYYRFLGVSGLVDGSPYLREIEFKGLTLQAKEDHKGKSTPTMRHEGITINGTEFNILGEGDRRGAIGVSSDNIAFWGGTGAMDLLVSNSTISASTGKYINSKNWSGNTTGLVTFDFKKNRTVFGFEIKGSGAWTGDGISGKVYGQKDGSNDWVDIGDFTNININGEKFVFNTYTKTTKPERYRYYKIVPTSGVTYDSRFIHYFEIYYYHEDFLSHYMESYDSSSNYILFEGQANIDTYTFPFNFDLELFPEIVFEFGLDNSDYFSSFVHLFTHSLKRAYEPLYNGNTYSTTFQRISKHLIQMTDNNNIQIRTVYIKK